MSNNQCTGVNPSDLMIGNYVMYDGIMRPVLAIDPQREFVEMGYKGAVTVPQYLPDGVTVFTTTGVWCNKASPVPLTPEILDKCEVFRHDKNFQKAYRLYVSLGMDIFVWFHPSTKVASVHVNGDKMRHIKYLHQLQNIYYLLTNKQLVLCKHTNS